MTVQEFQDTLKEISKNTGDKVEIMEQLKTLQTAFEEAAGAQPKPDLAPDGQTWKNKYEASIALYRERFFSGAPDEKEPDAPPPSASDIKEGAQDKADAALNTDYNALFKDKE